MAHKRLLFHGEAQTRVLRGATALADAVRITLGPKSKSVLIQKKFGRPIVCNDGVTIAREVALEDAEENLGTQMMREAAERTGEAAGDGTAGRFVDLVANGIIAPTKVVRVALENAVSVAGILLLTEATLTELPEKEPAARAPAMEGLG